MGRRAAANYEGWALSNYKDRADDVVRRAHEVSELPYLKRAQQAQGLALDALHLVRDIAGELDRLKKGRNGDGTQGED